MSRLPIRWKVTLAFAAACAVVLAAVGAFLYLRLDAELEQSLDRGLRARGGELAALVQRSAPGRAVPDAPAIDADETPAQVLGEDGTVVQGTSQAGFALLT